MRSGGERRARLIVAFAPEEQGNEMLEAAVRLASRLDRELVGLMLEDHALQAAAAVPFARLISASGAAATLDHAYARRAARLLAERLRRDLARLAERRRIAWSFEIVSGGLAALRLETGDVLALAPGAAERREARGETETPEALPCPVVLLGGGRGPVLALFQGSTEALDLAARIAHADGTPLVVLALGGPLSTAAQLAEIARRRVAARDAVEAVSDDRPETLARVIGALRPSVLVFDACHAGPRWRSVLAALTARRSAA